MAKVILKAQDLDGYLTPRDKATIENMNGLFDRTLEPFTVLSDGSRAKEHARAKGELVSLYNEMGHAMRDIVAQEPNLHVYSFGTPREVHGEVSRLIAKLRDVRTERPEFIYYTQRAYELLFNFAFGAPAVERHNIVVETPVTLPVRAPTLVTMRMGMFASSRSCRIV